MRASGNMAPGCCQTSVAKYTRCASNNFSNKKCYSAISVVLTHDSHLECVKQKIAFPTLFFVWPYLDKSANLVAATHPTCLSY